MMIYLRNFSLVGFLALSLLILGGQLNEVSANAPNPVHGKFMQPQDQIKLTPSSIEKVIQVLPELIALTKNYKGKHSTGSHKKIAPNSKYTAFTKALNALSGKAGFEDAPTMQRTVEATMLTTGFLKSGKTLKQVDDQMLATQKTIMDNPKLSKIQKNSLLQRMAIQVSMVIPSPENIKTVMPFYQRIIAISDKK